MVVGVAAVIVLLEEDQGEGWLWGSGCVWLFVGSFPGLCVSLSVHNVHWLRCGCVWIFVVQF